MRIIRVEYHSQHLIQQSEKRELNAIPYHIVFYTKMFIAFMRIKTELDNKILTTSDSSSKLLRDFDPSYIRIKDSWKVNNSLRKQHVVWVTAYNVYSGEKCVYQHM